MHRNDFILTLSCPDRIGIVYNVSGLLLEHQGNIIDAQQFGDEETGRFFLRVHFALPEGKAITQVEVDFNTLSAQFEMQWQIHDAQRKARLLILVSKQGHCLNDLLFRMHSKQLHADIIGIVSNHPDFSGLAESFKVPFHYLPVTPDTKAQQEAQILEIARLERIDLVVLARYMQILSPELCKALQGRAINIHHSFLPGFKGAKPYHQAHARGVKMIGATAHYVTADLDEGPIIDQDVVRVTHARRPEDLVTLGRDVERSVLARAARLLAEDRVALVGQRTVVFSQ